MATQLQERRADPVVALRQSLSQMGDQLKMALPSHINVEKFQRVTMTAIQANPDLLNADRRSLFGAVVKAAQDGLLPDGREGALVIFNQKNRQTNGWDKKVQWMPMIAGVLKKIRQSGEIASVDVHVVHEHDKFTYRPGLDTVPVFEPDWFADRGAPIGAYAIATLKTGEVIPPEIMNVQQIEAVRKVSRASDKGPWVDWWGEMARKTVMRRFAKRLPSSTDIEAEFERDETMLTKSAALAMAAEPEVQQIEAHPPLGRLDALEQQIETQADVSGEGPADEQRGEAHSDAVTLQSAMAEIDACETVIDVDRKVQELALMLSEEDGDELYVHAGVRKTELGAKK
ncbi:recombinase RecT [Sphingobium sp. PNB]|uniref:recombinase RecT n=1 Tax=Sphingobium sp. PNB TaxID=863934 RepID=UPI001CA3A2A1|nr:recombinase RecT [Sphingobium sp. PNB]MCB4863196.1 recombinase RecT [Sphingobium sp. PNB]